MYQFLNTLPSRNQLLHHLTPTDSLQQDSFMFLFKNMTNNVQHGFSALVFPPKE